MFGFTSFGIGERVTPRQASGAWRIAVDMTDNRLRAARAWIELRHGKRTEKIVDFLINDLAARLNRLGVESAHTGDRDRILQLRGTVSHLQKADWPTFDVVYTMMGLPAPLSVGAIDPDYAGRPDYPNLGLVRYVPITQRDEFQGRPRTRLSFFD